MKVLLVKMTSFGDVLHTLPAIQDAFTRFPELNLHWLVDESFAEIPQWHPAVKKIIKAPLRRFKKNKKLIFSLHEWQFLKELRQEQYDLIIDAQGLLKSALFTALGRGLHKIGLSFKAAREPLASFFYEQKIFIPKDVHAIARTRRLFAKALGYQDIETLPTYGLTKPPIPSHVVLPSDYILFFHGTTWVNKHWPEEYWKKLAELSIDLNLPIYLPWGNDNELKRSERIASTLEYVHVLPKLTLTEISGVVSHATKCVAVDTGLAHLAAAFDVPTISLYGPTDPKKSGALGEKQIHLFADKSCAPCLERSCRFEKDSLIYPPCFEQILPNNLFKLLKTMECEKSA